MRSAFNLSDFVTDDVALIKDVYTEVGSYKVVAGEIVTLGYGSGNFNTAEGRIYADLKDTSAAQIKGNIRFVIESAQDMPLKVLDEYDIETLKTSATDRRQQITFDSAVDGIEYGASEDKKIKIYIKSSDNVTLDVSASTLKMDINRVLV